MPVRGPARGPGHRPLRTPLQALRERCVVWGLLGLIVCGGLQQAHGQALSEADTAACPPATLVPTPDALAAARRQARDRGLLWRIGKDGRSSFLFGTLHLGRLDWAFQGPQFDAAWQASDTLALELDLTDAATLQALAEGSLNGVAGTARGAARDSAAQDSAVQHSAGQDRAPPEAGAQTVSPLGAGASAQPAARPYLRLTAAEQARLDRLSARICLPSGALSRLHPVMQAVTLLVQASRWDGLDPAYGQESILAGRAKATGRPIVALESVALQLATLVPADATDARRVLLDLLDQLEAGRIRPMQRRLAEAWVRGDLDTLERYADWCDCLDTPEERADFARLNDARNPALADAIAAQHAQGRKVFAAVGALHMSGPRALPLLMQERGYTVERISFKP